MDYLTCKKIFFEDRYEVEGRNRCFDSNKFDLVLSLIVSIFAFSLSWNCNTARNLSFFVKLFYGSFAFIFGSLYVLFYLLFNYGTCNFK